MTREEALKVLDTIPTIGEQVDALEMAIKALEQQSCEDCISRQAVLDAIDAKAWEFCDYLISKNRNDEQKPVSHFADNLRECVREELPSVEPQPKMGEWLKNGELCKCSNCHSNVLFSAVKSYSYCYHCGARMEVSE